MLDNPKLPRPSSLHEEHGEVQAVPRVGRQSSHQPSVLSVVREGQGAAGIGVGHPLHQFAQGSEEVIHLLGLPGNLPIRLDDDATLRSAGVDVGPPLVALRHHHGVAVRFEVFLHDGLHLVLGEEGARRRSSPTPSKVRSDMCSRRCVIALHRFPRFLCRLAPMPSQTCP